MSSRSKNSYLAEPLKNNPNPLLNQQSKSTVIPSQELASSVNKKRSSNETEGDAKEPKKLRLSPPQTIASYAELLKEVDNLKRAMDEMNNQFIIERSKLKEQLIMSDFQQRLKEDEWLSKERQYQEEIEKLKAEINLINLRLSGKEVPESNVYRHSPVVNEEEAAVVSSSSSSYNVSSAKESLGMANNSTESLIETREIASGPDMSFEQQQQQNLIIEKLKAEIVALKEFNLKLSAKQGREQRGNRMGKRYDFPKEATDVLKKWILEHIQNPYPTKEEKEDLSRATGLTTTQLNDWFTNYRRRHLRRSSTSSNADETGKRGQKGSSPSTNISQQQGNNIASQTVFKIGSMYSNT